MALLETTVVKRYRTRLFDRMPMEQKQPDDFQIVLDIWVCITESDLYTIVIIYIHCHCNKSIQMKRSKFEAKTKNRYRIQIE